MYYAVMRCTLDRALVMMPSLATKESKPGRCLRMKEVVDRALLLLPRVVDFSNLFILTNLDYFFFVTLIPEHGSEVLSCRRRKINPTAVSLYTTCAVGKILLPFADLHLLSIRWRLHTGTKGV